MKNRKAVTITDNASGRSIECEVLDGVHGRPVVDIRSLPSKLGYFTYDPGFASTASCSSTITYIDGREGVLLYRGYPIEQLAERSSFLEICYLLLYGELPDKAQWSEFNAAIRRHTMVHEGMRRFIAGYQHDAHPMGMLVGIVGALSTFYHEDLDISNPEHRELAAIRMDREAPLHRRRLLQVQHRPALHVPDQLARLRGELSPDDVRGPGRAVPAESRWRCGRWSS